MSTTVTIPASDIAIGDAVFEADGYQFAVIAVTRTRGLVELTLASEFSPLLSTRAGIKTRKRPSSLLVVGRGWGWDVAPTLLQLAGAKRPS